MYENVPKNFNPYKQNLSHVKDFFKKPIVLIIAIFHIVSLALSLITTLGDSTVGKHLYQAELISSDYYDLIGNPVFGLVLMTPSIIFSFLIIIAYFLIYAKSRSSKPESSPRVGFSIMQIIAVFQLIGAVIVVAAMAFVGFVMWTSYLSASDYYFFNLSTSATLINCIIATSIFILLAILILIYSVSNLRFFKSLKRCISSVNLVSGGAKGLAVTSVVFAVIQALALAAYILLSGVRSYSNEFMIISIITIAVSIIIYILQAIIALGYRKHVYRITSSVFSDNYESKLN